MNRHGDEVDDHKPSNSHMNITVVLETDCDSYKVSVNGRVDLPSVVSLVRVAVRDNVSARVDVVLKATIVSLVATDSGLLVVDLMDNEDNVNHDIGTVVVLVPEVSQLKVKGAIGKVSDNCIGVLTSKGNHRNVILVVSVVSMDMVTDGVYLVLEANNTIPDDKDIKVLGLVSTDTTIVDNHVTVVDHNSGNDQLKGTVIAKSDVASRKLNDNDKDLDFSDI